MLLVSLFILTNYLQLGECDESFYQLPMQGKNQNLFSTMETIFCSTDSDAIHLLASEKGSFDEIGEFIELMSRHCTPKTVQISAVESFENKLPYYATVDVIMVNSRKAVARSLETVIRFQRTTTHKFVLILKFQFDLKTLQNIFRKLSEKTVFRIIVLMENDKFEVFAYTFDPLDETFDSLEINKTLQRNRDLFIRDRSELRGRNLVVTMHEQSDRAVMNKDGTSGYTGVDGLIAKLMEERMNATFTYITPEEMYNGNRNSGVIGDLTSGNADISFNADSLAPSVVSETLDVTEPIELNDMCILVPKAGNEPTIYNLLRTLSKVTWLVSLLSLVVMMCVYRWTQQIQKLIHSENFSFYEYSWTEISSMIFQSFFGDSITRIPLSMPLRILVIGWCIYSFLITNAFQAKLISSLVTPKGLPDIETLEHLGHSNLKIMYPKALANHLKGYIDDDTMSLLKDQLHEVKTWNAFEAAICNKTQTNTAFIMMRFHAEVMEKMSFDKISGKLLYRTMKECLLSFPRVYFLKFGSMYRGYVSELLLRFHESGFIVKWESLSDFMNGLHGIVVEEEDENEVDESNIKVVITIDHLQTAFYLLFLGLTAALLVFIGENINYRQNHKFKSIISGESTKTQTPH